jgi:hypothetical protein
VQVVIGAPPVIAADMLRCFGIKLVVRGSVSETNIKVDGNGSRCVWAGGQNSDARAGRPALHACACRPVTCASCILPSCDRQLCCWPTAAVS